MGSRAEMPFYSMSDYELKCEIFCSYYIQALDNSYFYDSLKSVMDDQTLSELNFQYTSADNFTDKVEAKINCVDISVFHVNIRSLNRNHSELCIFLESLKFHFDVIVLSEIWDYNLQLYDSILQNYNFYYDIPKDSKVGGIGVYIKDSIQCSELTHLKINPSLHRVENIWFDLNVAGTHYRLGCIYRHPNQNINEFTTLLDSALYDIRMNNIPCIIAGDINIDFCKYNKHVPTTDYINNLLVNNYLPVIVMPTRITEMYQQV